MNDEINGNKKKILIVDDEFDIVELLKLRLEINGFAVMTAFDGIEALEKIREEMPDMILMDIKMPRLNGYKVTKAIRENPVTRNVPIFIITAMSKYTSNVAEQCRDLGIADVFYKPFDSVQLLTKIRECLHIQ